MRPPRHRRRRLITIAALLLALAVVIPVYILPGIADWLASRSASAQPLRIRSSTASRGPAADDKRGVVAENADPSSAAKDSLATLAPTAARPLNAKFRQVLEQVLGGPDVPSLPYKSRKDELVISFRDREGLGGFVGDMDNFGFSLTGTILELSVLRIKVGTAEGTSYAIARHQDDIVDISPNWEMTFAEPISSELEVGHLEYAGLRVLLGSLKQNNVLAEWGRGVTIAMLDTGVDPTAQYVRNVRAVLDAGWGVSPTDTHGTAIAELAAGNFGALNVSGYWGVAPFATLISVKVTDLERISDVFTVARGIVLAAGESATIIDVSPASPVEALVLARAIDFADSRLSLIVAAGAGSYPGWPANDPRVIGVGAIDAISQRTLGPAYPVSWQTGAPRIYFSTSIFGADAEIPGHRIADSPANAAVVAGALAAVLSMNQGKTAGEAWEMLQKSTLDSSNTGSAIPEGYHLLNLSWLGTRALMSDQFLKVVAMISANPTMSEQEALMAVLGQEDSGGAVTIPNAPSVTRPPATTPSTPRTITVRGPIPPAPRAPRAAPVPRASRAAPPPAPVGP